MLYFLFLLLPVAAVTSWYAGYRSRIHNVKKTAPNLPRDYFIGLKYLIEEQPDKAVDVFIKLLEVNSDTVETHLALGSLFRRRGEVDRAIRIHQNLIARPQLAKAQRVHAMTALAEDYLCAGVLDRAENLFLELSKIDSNSAASYTYLLDIYEQQKDWDKAIACANRLQNKHGIAMHTTVAHYYCELNNPRKALAIDKACVRAELLLSEECLAAGNYKDAIRLCKKAVDYSPDYISEVIRPLATAFEGLHDDVGCIKYLQDCLTRYPRISIILALAGFLRKHNGDFAAIEFITEQMMRYPSLRGLDCLTDLYIDNSEGNTKGKLLLLQKIMHDLLGAKPIYRCRECGFASKVLYWHCPSCRRWGLVKPIHGLEGD